MGLAPRSAKNSRIGGQAAASGPATSSIRVLRNEDEIREAYKRVAHLERRNAVLINNRVAHYEKVQSIVRGRSNETLSAGRNSLATEVARSPLLGVRGTVSVPPPRGDDVEIRTCAFAPPAYSHLGSGRSDA
jgi:hypothetical protein